MSLADKYPHLRTHRSPDWVVSAPDDDADLVQAARKSLLEAIHETSPQASLPYRLDLRLIGSSTRDGHLPADAMVVAQRFQHEVREALRTPALRTVEIDWVGISEGSAVVHMAPRLATAPDDGGFESAHADEFEAAVAHVVDVHNRLESEAQDADFAGERPALLDRVRLLTEMLNDQALDLGVIAYGSQGRVYRSTLSRRGRMRAQELFQRVENQPVREQLAGLVISADLEAQRITMRDEKHRGKIEISNVPEELIRSGDLRAGIDVAVVVESATDTDHAGTQRSARRTWAGFAPEQSEIGELE